MKTRVLFLGLILLAGRILTQPHEFGVYTEEELSIETVPFEPEDSVS